VASDRLRFIVIADSHIRSPDDEVDVYPSNASLLGRNQHVVDLCNQIDAAFVVHLGDIVHPIPAQAAHEDTVKMAKEVYAALGKPIYFAPGNHDIGDKPDALVAVPAVEESFYSVFERHWGPAYRSFDEGDCHFVLVDTPVLGSGLAREHGQRAWLERDLAAASAADCRIFMFTHYPPFVYEPGEDEHYDNLGKSARSWLLGLVERHGVEAVFSGHVHNFLFNHHQGTDLYVVPSTGFVRPDYSELAAVAPEQEYGREDPAKLGFFVVDVTPDGHRILPVRTFGAVVGEEPDTPLRVALHSEWQSPVGVTLRHGWMDSVGFPTEGLDEFRRKVVRNDAVLPALWEARVGRIRIPIGDIATAEGVSRLVHLSGRGMRFTVRSGGVPDIETLDVVRSLASHLDRWEVVVPEDRFAALLEAVEVHGLPDGVPLAVAPIVPRGGPGHHFVTSGFQVHGEAALTRWLELDAAGVFGELAFRVPAGEPVGAAVGAAAVTAEAVERRAVVTVELPRAAEAVLFDDDDAVAAIVTDAVVAAADHRAVTVFLDGFIDHDRGYYPRHGLVDRRFNPRPALRRLMMAAAAEAGSGGT
jgi:3',5'-cyclic AMP phosphodiesterase CpdA